MSVDRNKQVDGEHITYVGSPDSQYATFQVFAGNGETYWIDRLELVRALQASGLKFNTEKKRVRTWLTVDA